MFSFFTRGDTAKLREANAELRAANSKLRIEVEEVKAERARVELEIDHKLGLAKLRMEQDSEAATRAAKLEVRELNLKQRESAFEEKLAWIKQRMEAENTYVRQMFDQVLQRLPDVSVKFKGGV
jgi:hypothetical protein